MKYEGDDDTNFSQTTRNNLQEPGKENGAIRNLYENIQTTARLRSTRIIFRNPRKLMRLAVRISYSSYHECEKLTMNKTMISPSRKIVVVMQLPPLLSSVNNKNNNTLAEEQTLIEGDIQKGIFQGNSFLRLLFL